MLLLLPAAILLDADFRRQRIFFSTPHTMLDMPRSHYAFIHASHAATMPAVVDADTLIRHTDAPPHDMRLRAPCRGDATLRRTPPLLMLVRRDITCYYTLHVIMPYVMPAIAV